MAGVKKYKTKKQIALAEAKRKKYKSEYNTAFIKEHYKRIEVKLKIEEDADIIEHLESIESVNAYIKELIRKDMGKSVEK